MNKEQIQEVLDEVRKDLQADGGDLELVDVGEDGVVKVKLRGACAGCPGAQMTLTFYVERVLKERVPEVKEVVAV